eukprot:255513-Rhodomonas_salina.3
MSGTGSLVWCYCTWYARATRSPVWCCSVCRPRSLALIWRAVLPACTSQDHDPLPTRYAMGLRAWYHGPTRVVLWAYARDAMGLRALYGMSGTEI